MSGYSVLIHPFESNLRSILTPPVGPLTQSATLGWKNGLSVLVARPERAEGPATEYVQQGVVVKENAGAHQRRGHPRTCGR